MFPPLGVKDDNEKSIKSKSEVMGKGYFYNNVKKVFLHKRQIFRSLKIYNKKEIKGGNQFYCIK